ncbi:hypothetical protein OAT73_01530 [Candidatus Poseidoniaceae archaeon]|nr:hypothetical protein [Candidatus Poseidoniaceae archaeon]
MVDSVFSPDGKFMWTGSEWIPSPPQEANREPLPSVSQSGDIRDSVVMGDVNRQITQNITYQTSPISAEELALAISKAMSMQPTEHEENHDNTENNSEYTVVEGMKVIEPDIILFESVYHNKCVIGNGAVIRDSFLLDSSIGAGCSITDSVTGSKSEIGDGVILRDSATGKSAKIGRGCIIIDSAIEDGVVIPDNTYINQKIVKSN